MATILDQAETGIPLPIAVSLAQSERSVSETYRQPPYSPSITEEIKLARTGGRGIRRLVTLCGTVTQLVAEYDRRLLRSRSNDDDADDAGDDNDDDDGDNENLSPENKEEIKR